MNLQVLGKFILVPLGLKRLKLLLLLVYLRLQGPHHRKHLAHLFWPDAPDPLNNLRVALQHLKQLHPGLLHAEGQQLSCLLPSDASDLQEAMQQQDHLQVIRLYQGAFMPIDPGDLSEELEEWVFETRERLASTVQWARLYRARQVQSRDPLECTRHIEAFFQTEGAPPPTAEMLQFLHGMGLSGHLEQRVSREAAELGLELHAAPPRHPQPKLVAPLRPLQVFVGREPELQVLHEKLHPQRGTLLTLTGLGGVGKTALVQQFCALHHPTGTLWLKAEGLQDASGLLHQLGNPSSHLDPWQGLLDALQHHQGLVVLDGADQLNEVWRVQDWVDRAGLQVLLTRRQPLGLPDEQVLRLDPFLVQEYQGLSAAEALDHVAVRCFEGHARRQHATFRILPEQAQEALQLCAALSGLPLALQMAASWTQVLTLPEILEEIEQVLVPAEDGGGLRRIFDATWHLLSASEQQALVQLGCFLGSFTRGAALQVSGVHLTTLQQLVNKCMVQPEPHQRFRVPQVWRAFLAAPPAEVLERHQAYHLQMLKTLEVQPGRGLLSSAGSIPDLMEVVRQGLKSQAQPTFPLLRMLEQSSLHHVGLQFYTDLLRTPGHQITDDLRIEHAWLLLWTGGGYPAYQICLGLLSSSSDPGVRMKAHNMVGIYHMLNTRYREASQCFVQADLLARGLQEHEKSFLYQTNLLWTLLHLCRFKEARTVQLQLQHTALLLGSPYYDSYVVYTRCLLEACAGEGVGLDLRGFIEQCIQQGYFALAAFSMLIQLRGKGPLDAAALQQCEQAMGLAQKISSRSLGVQLQVVKWQGLCWHGQPDLLLLQDILQQVKQERDKFAFMELLVFVLQEAPAGVPGLARLQAAPYFSPLQQRTAGKTSHRLAGQGMPWSEVVQRCLEVLDWLQLTDRPPGWEDLPGPLPGSGGSRSGAPHPRFPELPLSPHRTGPR